MRGLWFVGLLALTVAACGGDRIGDADASAGRDGAAPGVEIDRRQPPPAGTRTVGASCSANDDCASNNCIATERRSDTIGSSCNGNESCRSFNCVGTYCQPATEARRATRTRAASPTTA